jgi:hydroxymethylpyrimidine/phosphomethylpyrimidine kinase
LKNIKGKPKIALTIAGSDSGGCSGIQADLKVFRNLMVHGASAITCVTAQNTCGVQKLAVLSPHLIKAQIGSVISDLGCDAAKTGMLGNRATVRTVAAAVKQFNIRNLVIDPVMVSSSGLALLQAGAVSALGQELIPLGRLVTPNLLEAERLTKESVRTLRGMERAAAMIFDRTGCPVLIKGGHLPGPAIDIFYNGARIVRFAGPRIRTRNTRGTGCTLSAAIAAFLARQESLEEAIAQAKDYVVAALKNAYKVGQGPGPVGSFE